MSPANVWSEKKKEEEEEEVVAVMRDVGFSIYPVGDGLEVPFKLKIS